MRVLGEPRNDTGDEAEIEPAPPSRACSLRGVPSDGSAAELDAAPAGREPPQDARGRAAGRGPCRRRDLPARATDRRAPADGGAVRRRDGCRPGSPTTSRRSSPATFDLVKAGRAAARLPRMQRRHVAELRGWSRREQRVRPGRRALSRRPGPGPRAHARRRGRPRGARGRRARRNGQADARRALRWCRRRRGLARRRGHRARRAIDLAGPRALQAATLRARRRRDPRVEVSHDERDGRRRRHARRPEGAPGAGHVAWAASCRRHSLDELPQFINVLQGRMSIVGPRPHAVAHNEQYRRLIHGYMLRHKVRPGITGWAQINGWRGETDTLEKMIERVAHDIEYIRRYTLLRREDVADPGPFATPSPGAKSPSSPAHPGRVQLTRM